MTKPKVFIATPTYDSRVHVQYMLGVTHTIMDLKSKGVDVYLVPNLASTLLILGRNTLIEAFMKTDATHLMFIDSDLGFNGDSVSTLMSYDKDIVCGVYPSRKATTFIYRPTASEDGSFVSDKTHPHLIQADMIPAGFMCVKRDVIVKMRERFKHLAYAPKEEGMGDTGTLLFNTEVVDGEFWSEDYVFSLRAREVGAEIWMDPKIQFDHAGVRGSLDLVPEIKEHLKKVG